MLDLSARKVYGALEEAVNAIDAKVDNAILSIYKAGGSLEFDDLPSPSSDVANMAYLVTDAFTTTSDFVEGAGVDYPAGTYVAIVNTGTEDNPDYKYDVVPFTMVVDDTMSAVSENPLQNKVITGAVQEIRLDISNLSASKISKSETVGHVMNDGSIDENEYTEKVENATSGHLAGLDSNGNLTDSGVSPTEDVTVEGNPVTFVSPFEQDAKSVVVSVKPIQAGSGTPSPENIRPISGIDEVEVDVSADGNIVAWSDFHAPTGTSKTVDENTATLTCDGNSLYQSINDGGSAYQGFTPGTYRVRFNVESVNNTSFCHLSLRASNDSIKSSVQITGTGKYSSLLMISENCYLSWILNGGTAVSNTLVVSDFSVEKVVNTTTIPLPSTLYGGTVDVTEGTDTPTYGMVDLGSLDYSATAIDNQYFAIISSRYKAPTSLSVKPNWICESYDIGLPTYTDSLPLSNYTIGCFADFSQNNIVFVRDPRCSSAAEMKTALNGVKLTYELATPETPISLTPKDVELLEGTNVVSTNAEKVAVTYGRSLWQDIDDLKTDTEGKLDKSDVADVEGDTASKAYSVNDFMLRSDGFYKVTAPIAQNASITSSNTTKTTIGAVLTALLNA